MGLGVRPTQALLHPAQPSLRTGRSRHPGHGRRPVLGLPCPFGPPHNTRTLGTPVLGWQVLRSSPETPARASSGRALLGLPQTAR